MLGWLLALLTLLAPTASAQTWTAAPEAIEVEAELPPVPQHWTTVPGTWVRVHGHDADTALLLRLARHASQAFPRLAERLQVPTGGTVDVYVATSDAEFRALQPGDPPLWADATAWPRLGAVFLRSPDARDGTADPIEQVLEHELVHVLLGRAFAPATPPTWLQEGTAQLLAGEVGPQVARTLARGAASGGLVSLEALERGFPDDPLRAELAYAEAADFVGHLEGTYGPDALPTLVRASAGGATMRQAVRQATGRFLEDVERDWEARLGGPAFRLAGLAGGDWAWGVAAFALVGAGIARRRRFRQRLREMEEEEAQVDALAAELRVSRAP